ncbi:hypothetical protein [Salisediminibacterium beveridgei]|uniref:Uncharacterized protein n=1 Tax=Salisediminibacterium beveridgei TaxID=632773 RepID=A0A1D7QRP1_9BACI|nr:hypothetical protein [Salisediminibacterium beveridgei]AOM81661.1 hypothetical protein BBEV_0267 [Salisediminibacterium beveridgei]
MNANLRCHEADLGKRCGGGRFEPVLPDGTFYHFRAINDFDKFKEEPDIMVVNLLSDDFFDEDEKAYTRETKESRVEYYEFKKGKRHIR